MESQKTLLIEWTKQCFQAAGLETSDKEVRKFAATAANEVINEGFMGFAEGNSVPHGSGSNSVAGGVLVPGFIAYINRSAPQDEEGRLETFDEIVQRFVDLTTTAEAAEIGPLMNTNRAVNAANEILQQYFETRSGEFVQMLHDSFGDDSTPIIDMSKVTVGKAMSGSGCAIAALVVVCSAVVVAALLAVIG
jgi:hypothetical protein